MQRVKAEVIKAKRKKGKFGKSRFHSIPLFPVTLSLCKSRRRPERLLNFKMSRSLRFLVLILAITTICEAATFNPISDAHRSAALDLCTPSNGSFESLEETYEALRTFEVLGIDKASDIKKSACASVVETLWSATSASNSVFQALRVNGILKCELNDEAFSGIASRLKESVQEANTLLDFYHTIGSLKIIKDQSPDIDLHLEDVEGSFRAIKALSQSDGRWRYGSNNPESSNFAAGIALETLAGVVSLASQDIDNTLIETLKKDIRKLFDGVESYDDGSCYFDEKLADARENQGPLSASSSVVRGLTAFAASTSESLNLPGDKLLCLAKFFLGVGVPSNAKDLYYQIDALGFLESNRVSIPLILSVPATVLSTTRKDKLKVWVSTVLGSPAPALSVKLKQIFTSGAKDASVIDQELKFDAESGAYVLDILQKDVDVGVYTLSFEIVLHDSENKKIFATGGRTRVPVYVTGVVSIDHAEISILDSDLGTLETKNKLDLIKENSISLSANHLQKFRLAFQLATPAGNAFKPHQAFIQLTHESGVDHIFLVGSSGKKFELTLDFLGLVEKFYYLSGRYDLKLTVGDFVMENSFFRHLGHLDLDLPDAPEKAARPPPSPVDPYSRYGPKAEINHIFRSPEKRPPTELSFTFLGLLLLPLIGFLVGLILLRVNLSNFPRSSGPAAFAVLFHLGIAAVLLLYLLFWVKLDLFTTLKALGLLGTFLMFVGHKTLSHLASTSAKLKSA